MHLLARFSRAHDALFGLLENGALMIALRIDEHISALRKLHQKYRDRPMSLAAACIVRMAEIYEQHVVTNFSLTIPLPVSVKSDPTRQSMAATNAPRGDIARTAPVMKYLALGVSVPTKVMHLESSPSLQPLLTDSTASHQLLDDPR